MPRLNSGLELFQRLTSIEKFVLASPAPIGDTTTSALVAAAALNLPLTAFTNFANGDPLFIIGSGGFELNAINGTPAAITPLAFPLALAQAAGARVAEARRIDLGHLDENGVTMNGSLTLTPVNAATSRVAIASIAGQGTLGGSFNLRGYNNLNLQTVFGATEGEAGTGTATDPHTAVIDQNTVGSQNSLLVFRARGLRNDGSVVQTDFVQCTPSVNAQVQMGGTNPAVLGVAFNCTGIIQRIWTP